MGYTARNGRQASTTGQLVRGSNANPQAALAARQVAAIAPSVRRAKRAPPMITLSIVSITASSTLGSASNCIAAIQKPPIAASKVRFWYSACSGSSRRA